MVYARYFPVLTILLSLLISCSLESLHLNVDASQTYEKVIDQQESNFFKINKIIASNDGGFLIAGFRNANGLGKRGFLHKIDQTGNIQNTFILFYQGYSESEIRDVLAVPGLGYLICGNMVFDDVPHFYVGLVGEEGTLLADNDFENYEAAKAFALLKRDDNSFWVAGSIEQIDQDRAFLQIIDRDLEVLDTRTHPHGALVDLDRQGEGPVYGFTSSLEGRVVIELEEDGSIAGTVDVSGDVFANDVTEWIQFALAGDGGFAFNQKNVTSVFTNSSVSKFSAAGDLQWRHDISNVAVEDIIRTTDANLVVVGSTIPFNVSGAPPNVYLAKIDGEAGSENWAQQYGGELSDYGCNVMQTTDGGYFAVGIDQSLSSSDLQPGDQGIYLIKTDREGEVVN